MEGCMVMKMNKTKYIKNLSEVTNFSMDKCEEINKVIEDNGFIGKNTKARIQKDLVEKLNITEEEAEDIYEKTMGIIAGGLKEKITHPFKGND